MTISVQLIDKPTDLQIEQAVALLLRAFKGDISVDSMTGGDDALRPSLFRSMVRAGALEGSFYVVNDTESGDIFTIGIWFGPGKMMFNSEAQRKEGWDDFFAGLQSKIQDWWLKVFHLKHENTLNSLLGDQYLTHWFGNVVATDPEHQKKGYASEIVRAVCKRANEEGKTVALATQSERNKIWYEGLGFKTLGEVEIPADTGSWPDFFLIWEAPEKA